MTTTAAPGGAASISLTVAWFPRAILEGKPALGDPETLCWGEFASIFEWRREGDKDGPNFIPARFELEPDGRHVRRKKRNLLARTAIALDLETNKETGEVPSAIDVAVARIEEVGWAAVLYTSHNHKPDAARYRIVLPLSEEVAHELPAPEVVAERLGLRGVLDESKIGAASLFYLPSANYGELNHHHAEVINGAPIDAPWVREAAGAILAEREAEKERQAQAAHAEAAARREAKIAAGFDPDDSLIEKLRTHFDLEDVLLSHSYDKAGGKFRHPNSSSGSYGADIKAFGGIERVFSHNGTDPLHASNLPDWCGSVAALDAVDATIILDFAGDRKKALAALAERFGLTKREEQKKLARLIFNLIREQTPQEEIKRQAYAEGERLGMTRAEVIQVATWVVSEMTKREAA